MDYFDVGVIGAGAAGMMSAAIAGQRGAKVVLIDHSPRLAEKIRISGGGRCNFTNLYTSPKCYLSAQPKFCQFALKAFQPKDFLRLLTNHRLTWHEKHKGQLFCDQSSDAIIQMLFQECEHGGVAWRRPVQVKNIFQDENQRFIIQTHLGEIAVKHLIIATGGLSIPKIGATDFAFKLAKQFGHRLIEPRPALVPLTFSSADWQPFKVLSGVSLNVKISVEQAKKIEFDEDILLTHRGLSGPGILQVSSYWKPNQSLSIDLLPQLRLPEALLLAKQESKQKLSNYLSQYMPQRFVAAWLNVYFPDQNKRLAEIARQTLLQLSEGLSVWKIKPTGTEGYRKAEVTVGGIDTKDLFSNTMMSQKVKHLYFIGEAVDVTGWLGGYNFQWAWSSAFVAACAASQA